MIQTLVYSFLDLISFPRYLHTLNWFAQIFLCHFILRYPDLICTGMCCSKCWWFFKEAPLPSSSPSTRATKNIINWTIFFQRESKYYFPVGFIENESSFVELQSKLCRKCQPIPFIFTSSLLYYLENPNLPFILTLLSCLFGTISIKRFSITKSNLSFTKYLSLHWFYTYTAISDLPLKSMARKCCLCSANQNL